MFSTSLRKRREWRGAPDILRAAEDLKLREAKLENHDIELAIGEPTSGGSVSYRFLCLSAVDVGMMGTSGRIERLALGSGRRDAAILFLLSDSSFEGGGTAAFLKLQADIATLSEAPIILPLSTLKDLPGFLTSFQNNLTAPKGRHASMPTFDPNELLQHCSEGGPISEGATQALRRLACSFKDLTGQIGHAEVRQRIYDLLGQNEGRRVVSFWDCVSSHSSNNMAESNPIEHTAAKHYPEGKRREVPG